MTTITQLPVPPTSADPENFDARADAFVGALPQFVTETNQVALEVNANRVAAEGASNAILWQAGTIYTRGTVVYSPSTYLSYRDSTGGLSNTDPALDPRFVGLNGAAADLEEIQDTLIEHDARLDAIEAQPRTSVLDEGVLVGSGIDRFDFVGPGVEVTIPAEGRARVAIPGADLTGVTQTLIEHDQRLDALEAEPELAIKDDGMQITPKARSINFAGAGVTAESTPQGDVIVTIPGAMATPLVVQDEGAQVEDDALTLNFVGAGVTASSMDGVVTINIPGGGGGAAMIAVDDEGLELTDMLTRLNFVGGGVVAEEISPGVIRVSIPGQMPISAKDEGVQIEDDIKSINFVGAGVTASSDPAGNLTVTIPGGGMGGNPLNVRDEGALVEDDALTLNFVGAGVTATSVDGVVTVEIPGAMGGGSPISVEDEGFLQTAELSTLNFVGDGVTAVADAMGRVTVTIGQGQPSPPPFNGGTGIVTADSSIYNFRFGRTPPAAFTNYRAAFELDAGEYDGGVNFSEIFVEKYSFEPVGEPVLEQTYAFTLAANAFDKYVLPPELVNGGNGATQNSTVRLCFNNGFVYLVAILGLASDTLTPTLTNRLFVAKFDQANISQPLWFAEHSLPAVNLGTTATNRVQQNGVNQNKYISYDGYRLQECQADINGFYIHLVSGASNSDPAGRQAFIYKLDLASGDVDFMIAGNGPQDIIDFAINTNNPSTGGIFTIGFSQEGGLNTKVLIKAFNSITSGLVWAREIPALEIAQGVVNFYNARTPTPNPLASAIATPRFPGLFFSSLSPINISVSQETGDPLVSIGAFTGDQAYLGGAIGQLFQTSPDRIYIVQHVLNQNNGSTIGSVRYVESFLGTRVPIVVLDTITYGPQGEYFLSLVAVNEPNLSSSFQNTAGRAPSVLGISPGGSFFRSIPVLSIADTAYITDSMSQGYNSSYYYKVEEIIYQIDRFTGLVGNTKTLPAINPNRQVSYGKAGVSASAAGSIFAGGFCIGADL